MTRLDWGALMRAGMVQLRLPPDVFWQLSPAELAMLLGNGQTVVPLDRAQMDALLAKYPDEKGET